MNRRGFLAVAIAAATAGMGLTGCTGPKAATCRMQCGATDGRQTIELRTYTFASEEKLQIFAGLFEKAMAPALNRAGCKPVGAFRMMKADNPKLNLEADALKVYVVVPHATPGAFFTLGKRLAADAEFMAAARPVMDTPMKDPVYLRVETQLLLGFKGCPAVSAPAKGPDRVAQLRIYESHNCQKAGLKVAMFNEGGEIEIFRRVGMNPVLFGQSLAGTLMPNLTYMLAFDSPAAMDEGWGAFRKDPAWTKLKDDPKYADTVSNISNFVLRPLPGSQI